MVAGDDDGVPRGVDAGDDPHMPPSAAPTHDSHCPDLESGMRLGQPGLGEIGAGPAPRDVVDERRAPQSRPMKADLRGRLPEVLPGPFYQP